MNVNLDVAEQVADAVLHEGYILYPYSAAAPKNRFRWQFGVVTPRTCSEGGGVDPWFAQTECLIETGSTPLLSFKVRGLQLQARRQEQLVDAPQGIWRPLEERPPDGVHYVNWDEGVLQERQEMGLPIISPSTQTFRFDVPGGCDAAPLPARSGAPAQRVVRERWPISCLVRVTTETVGAVVKLRIRVENVTGWHAASPGARDAVLRRSLVGVHLVLGVEDAGFVSLMDPPAHAAAAAATCQNVHTWPVLVGAPGSRVAMLSSPIILYDYPAVAPESVGDCFDATEIDELLALRVMTLTDEEKAAARATDERARRIVDRAERLPPAALSRLHGTIREFSCPERDMVQLGSTPVMKGTRVRVQPRRGADAMDMFLAGRTAEVAGVYRTLEDEVFVAVTLESDPGADLQAWYGRFFYFRADEVLPLEPAANPPADPRRGSP